MFITSLGGPIRDEQEAVVVCGISITVFGLTFSSVSIVWHWLRY